MLYDVSSSYYTGRQAALDGLYVVRTSVSGETLTAEQTVSAYKDLSQVAGRLLIGLIDRQLLHQFL